LHLRIFLLPLLISSAAHAQVFFTGLGGAAALSRDASALAAPVSAANYDAKVGGAFSFAGGFRFNDWISAQAVYTWNKNRVTSNQVLGSVFIERQQTAPQNTLGADALLYFRRRSSFVRPFLSAGPAWVHVLSQDKLGLRVAVGVDVTIKSGWGVRYTFTETMSPNPFGAALSPPATHHLMNFQNLAGVIKVF